MLLYIVLNICLLIAKELTVRDCSLFMPKGGSVIFKQFRHIKNLPLPGSGYFKKLPRPRLCDRPKM